MSRGIETSLPSWTYYKVSALDTCNLSQPIPGMRSIVIRTFLLTTSINDLGQSEMKSEVYRISGSLPPRMFNIITFIFLSSEIRPSTFFFRRNASMAVAWAYDSSKSVNSSNRCVGFLDVMCWDFNNGTDSMAPPWWWLCSPFCSKFVTLFLSIPNYILTIYHRKR